MKLHEYQSKDIFRKYNISVPEGRIAGTPDEAVEAAKILNGPPWVIKAQVHTGGRGKAGGVKLADSLSKVKDAASHILNTPLITKQTGSQAKKVRQVLVEKAVDIAREFYLSITMDRAKARPVMIFSQSGGMDIEKVAEDSPELIFKQYVAPEVGWMRYQGRVLIDNLGHIPDIEMVKSLLSVMEQVYRIFMTLDCSMVEINPLVITKTSKVIAADAKIEIDDNALIRQKELAALDDVSEKDPLDVKAQAYNLNYIRLDGNIGCMVNGAGLAMATMDVIKLAGAEPANFLDVGGGASEEMIKRGLEIILEDVNVKGILINIFGGILRCDVLARGVLAAVREVEIRVPLIIRLEGTNAEEGRKLLNESDLKFKVAETLADAAELVKMQVAR
jgi:succinyl-CoA synthetase beta subunit